MKKISPNSLSKVKTNQNASECQLPLSQERGGRGVSLLILFLLLSSFGAPPKEKSSPGPLTTQIKVSITVPNPGWAIKICEVYELDDKILVISKLNHAGGMSIQVISNTSDSIQLKISAKPIKHYVLGKRWGWENAEPYTFLKSKTNIQIKLSSGIQLLDRCTSD